MDPLTIGLLVGGGLGLIQGLGNEEKEKQQAAFRKAAIQWSPWTGMSDPGALNLPGALESTVGGAARGAMYGNVYTGLAEQAAQEAAKKASEKALADMMGTSGAGMGGGLGSRSLYSPY